MKNRDLINLSDVGLFLKNKILERDFWIAFILSYPFYADYLSWWFLLPPTLILFVQVFKNIRIEYDKFLYTCPLIIIIFFHLLALVFSNTPFAYQVLKDCLISGILICAFLFAEKNLIRYFSFFVIPIALVTAILGLGKVYLLENGYLFGPLLENCSTYPIGSALCVNYNNAGMLWLVASILCAQRNNWVILPIIIVAGVLSGSRRFLLLMPLVPVVWILVACWSQKLKFTFCVLATIILYSVIVNPALTERVRTGALPYKVLFSETREIDFDQINERINPTYTTVVLGTMTDGTFGTSSRLNLWKYGYSMVGFLPQGWMYHSKFSCKFSACNEFHYPHLPILSEWIIGGIFGAIVSLWLYLSSFYRSYLADSPINLCLFLAVLPYTLISGDTILSLPTCLAVMMLSSMGGLVSIKEK